MNPFVIIDTDILIDVGLGIPNAITYLSQAQQNSQLAISIITQMELIVGCRNKTELRKLDSFLQNYHVLGISETISEKAVDLLHKYRLSHGLLIADALIAATAIVPGFPLASKNQRDYQFIKELNLLIYV